MYDFLSLHIRKPSKQWAWDKFCSKGGTDWATFVLSPLSYVPSFSFLFLAKSALRVCLFEGEIWWIENFREEIGRNFFLEYVWLGGNEGK